MADDIFKSADWARGAAFAKPAETEAQAIIRNARALIADRERWNTGQLIDAEGAMCLYGALMKAGGADDEMLRQGDVESLASVGYDKQLAKCPWVAKAEPFLWAAANEQIERGLDDSDDGYEIRSSGVMMEWNDGSDHETVLAVMDRAYDLAGLTPGEGGTT